MESILKISDELAYDRLSYEFWWHEEGWDAYDAEIKKYESACKYSALILCQNGYKKLAQEVFLLDWDIPHENSGECAILAEYYRDMRYCMRSKIEDDEEDEEDEEDI